MIVPVLQEFIYQGFKDQGMSEREALAALRRFANNLKLIETA